MVLLGLWRVIQANYAVQLQERNKEPTQYRDHFYRTLIL